MSRSNFQLLILPSKKQNFKKNENFDLNSTFSSFLKAGLENSPEVNQELVYFIKAFEKRQKRSQGIYDEEEEQPDEQNKKLSESSKENFALSAIESILYAVEYSEITGIQGFIENFLFAYSNLFKILQHIQPKKLEKKELFLINSLGLIKEVLRQGEEVEIDKNSASIAENGFEILFSLVRYEFN